MTDSVGELEVVLAKVTRRLLPFLLLMYVLAFLDRANIGFAKPAFQADTGLSDAAFALGAGIFFVGYALFEIPSNLALHRFGARRWLARIMVTWGVVSASLAWARSPALFYVLRFLLGAAEAGFFPGIIYYLCRWYPPAARGPAVGLFYFGPPLAFILGGPLSGLLLELEGWGGFAGWQWMFLVEGLLASLVGLWAYGYLDDGPDGVTWLTAADKRVLARAIPASASRSSGPAGARAVWAAITDPRGLHLAAIYLLIQMSVYGVTFYLPAQVAGLVGRRVGLVVSLLTAVPWLAALLAAFFVPRWAARRGRPEGVAALALGCAGVGIALAAAPLPAWLGMAGLCLAAAGFIGVQPVFWTLPTSHWSGVAAAGGIAFINSLGNTGGFIAPNLRTWVEGWTGHPRWGLLTLAATAWLGAGLLAWLRPTPRHRD